MDRRSIGYNGIPPSESDKRPDEQHRRPEQVMQIHVRPTAGRKEIATQAPPTNFNSRIRPMLAQQVLVLIISLEPLLSQLLRNSTALLASILERAFHIGATEVGLLGGAFSLGMVIAVIPGGMLVQRFGSRLVLPVCGAFLFAGILWFSFASSVAELIAARTLMGIGSGPLMPALFAVLTDGSSQQTFRMLYGEGNFFGRLGTILATGPLAALFLAFGWRETLVGMACAVAAAALLAATALRRKTNLRPNPAEPGRFRALFPNKEILGPLAMMSAMGGSAFTLIGIWGAPWMGSAFHASTAAQASGVTAMAAAYALGALCSGLVSRCLGRATLPIFAGAAIVLLLAAALGFVGKETFTPFLAALGFSLSFTPLLTADIREAVPARLAVPAVSLTPVAFSSGVFFCQTGSGILLDLFPHSPGHHPPQAFQALFAALALLLLGAYVLFLATRRRANTA